MPEQVPRVAHVRVRLDAVEHLVAPDDLDIDVQIAVRLGCDADHGEVAPPVGPLVVEEPEFVGEPGVDVVVLRDLRQSSTEFRGGSVRIGILDQDVAGLVVDERDRDVVAQALQQASEAVRLERGAVVVDPLHGHDSDRGRHWRSRLEQPHRRAGPLELLRPGSFSWMTSAVGSGGVSFDAHERCGAGMPRPPEGASPRSGRRRVARSW